MNRRGCSRVAAFDTDVIQSSLEDLFEVDRKMARRWAQVVTFKFGKEKPNQWVSRHRPNECLSARLNRLGVDGCCVKDNAAL